MLKIASWNVNSLRVRLPQVETWLSVERPDILAIQETKVEDPLFPMAALQRLGYHLSYAGQRTYNGVALLSRTQIREVITDLPTFVDAPRRILAANTGNVRIINLYVPNGQSVVSDKYTYKLHWLTQVTDYIQAQLREHPRLIVLGDFNIAPQDEDVYDPIGLKGHILCSQPEREAFARLLAIGLHDTFRRFPQAPNTFSWWDYRAGNFRQNRGLRIDHILASTALMSECQSAYIDKSTRALERPSDHAPVLAVFGSVT